MNPKIYHILLIDNLPSVIKDKFLYSDAYMRKTSKCHSIIGMNKIKDRRLTICEELCAYLRILGGYSAIRQSRLGETLHIFEFAAAQTAISR